MNPAPSTSNSPDPTTRPQQPDPEATEQPPQNSPQHTHEDSNPRPQEVEDEDADPVGERQSGH
ncbi:MAG: hypothetical protein EOO27_37675 [Comamonadaceae bacterium]|nr:MAG: hypothetical protein EOO27_37675 [Comamonadaceae bacterium]